jgi:hypothetical protein
MTVKKYFFFISYSKRNYSQWQRVLFSFSLNPQTAQADFNNIFRRRSRKAGQRKKKIFSVTSCATKKSANIKIKSPEKNKNKECTNISFFLRKGKKMGK